MIDDVTRLERDGCAPRLLAIYANRASLTWISTDPEHYPHSGTLEWVWFTETVYKGSEIELVRLSESIQDLIIHISQSMVFFFIQLWALLHVRFHYLRSETLMHTYPSKATRPVVN